MESMSYIKSENLETRILIRETKWSRAPRAEVGKQSRRQAVTLI